MKEICFFSVMLLLISVSSFASPIPVLFSETMETINVPPPVGGDFPEQLPSDLEARRRPITDSGQVDLSNASSIYHYVPVNNSKAAEPVPEFPESAYSLPDFDFYTDAAVIGSVNVTNDSNQDVETSIMAVEKNGIVYTTTAYFKYVNSDPKLYYSSTTNTNFSSFTSGQLPLSQGYTWSADPLLDANTYTDGIAPKRIYLVGLLLDGPPSSGNYPGFDFSATALWRSDNGGYSWLTPIIVAQGTYTTGNGDKPDVAVSLHSGTRGYVYVAYVVLNGVNTELWVKMSTNGGVSFPLARLVEVGDINGAQVIVSPHSGNVYVVWTDFTDHAIRMSTSNNYGLTWTAPETVPGTGVPGTMLNSNNRISGNMKAGSLPMARFNWVANKVSIVWHECATTCTSTSSDTDVYYAAKSPSGWQAKVRVNDGTARDQFMPALDFDLTGNMIVTFYDRRDDSQNIKYHLYSARINSSGSRLEPNVQVSTFQSDPRNYTVNASFIGDYQDIWSQAHYGAEYYFPSWVGIPTNGDIWMSAIQP